MIMMDFDRDDEEWKRKRYDSMFAKFFSFSWFSMVWREQNEDRN